MYAQIKVSGGTKGRQRFRAPMSEAIYFFRDFNIVCIPGQMRVDVDPKRFGRGNLRVWEIARAGDRSRVLNLCRDPFTMNSVLDFF